MSSEFRQFDDQGLPLPQKFEDLHYADEEAPRKPRISQRKKRIVLLLLVLGVVVPVVFGPQIVSTVRETLGRWLKSRADRKQIEGDYRGALSDLNQAIGWNPDAWYLYAQRSQVRERLEDTQGSLADVSKAIDMFNDAWNNADRRQRRRLNRNTLLAELYARRCWIYVRLGQGREAVDDATEAVKLDDSSTSLNTRAYARAVCNMELNEGLADIEKAMQRAAQNLDVIPAFLDTRGYLLHLLDRNDEALKDLNRAVAMTDQSLNAFLNRQLAVDRRELPFLHELNRDLAVMLYHRGLVREALGQTKQAEQDLKRAEQLGYDPKKGIF
jgi:tetratricopeptide (TPR) repeat protein